LLGIRIRGLGKAVGKAGDDCQWQKFHRRLSQPKRAISPVGSRDD